MCPDKSLHKSQVRKMMYSCTLTREEASSLQRLVSFGMFTPVSSLYGHMGVHLSQLRINEVLEVLNVSMLHNDTLVLIPENV